MKHMGALKTHAFSFQFDVRFLAYVCYGSVNKLS